MIRAIHSFNHGSGLIRVWPTDSPDLFSVTVGREQIGIVIKAGQQYLTPSGHTFRRLSVAAKVMADRLLIHHGS